MQSGGKGGGGGSAYGTGERKTNDGREAEHEEGASGKRAPEKIINVGGITGGGKIINVGGITGVAPVQGAHARRTPPHGV